MSLKRYDGTNWVDVKTVKRYDDTQWVDCQFVRRWDGSQWVDVWTGKRMVFFYNGDATADCIVANGTATINMSVPSYSEGAAGLQGNFNLAAGDEVEVSFSCYFGDTGPDYRAAVIAVSNSRIHVWESQDVSSGHLSTTYTFDASISGPLVVYIGSSETLGIGVEMQLTVTSVKVNGVSITLAES